MYKLEVGETMVMVGLTEGYYSETRFRSIW